VALTEDLIQLNDANFESTVRSTPRLVVDCWAPWCGPCRMIAPAIEALAREYRGKVTFAKLDTDEAPKTAMALGIHSIPTIIYYRDGKQVERLIGARPRADLEAAVKKHLL